MLQEGANSKQGKEIQAMNKYSTVMKSLESEISRYEFQKSVNYFEGDKRIRQFTTKQLFSSLIFGQVTNSYSIREIKHSLEANRHRLHHNGLSEIKRSTFADALAKRDCRIFQSVYETLNEKASVLSGRTKRRFKNPLKLIDSTMIEVNVNRFSWAAFRQTKGGMKLHISYDPEAALPDQMFFTDGKVADIRRLGNFGFEEGTILVFDRAYCDYNSLRDIDLRGGYFVTRLKKHACYDIQEVFYEHTAGCVRRDMKVRFTHPLARKAYPKSVRLVEYYDKEKERVFLFLTNDFTHTAEEIAAMYKERWEIELFFKWIKQNLKIKTFWGTSRNAVLVQIWVALILYLLLWIMKIKNCVEHSLQRIRQILKTTLLAKQSLGALFKPPPLARVKTVEPYLFEGVL
jgi:hypothetical protein